MQKCSICIHPKRNEIDEALLLSTTPLRTIADQFHVSKSALLRHKTDHIPTDLMKAKQADESCRAEGLLDKLCQKINTLSNENLINAILTDAVITKIRTTLIKETGGKLTNDDVRAAIEKDLFQLE